MATETQILPNPRRPKNPSPPNLPVLYSCRDSSTNQPLFSQNKPNSLTDKNQCNSLCRNGLRRQITPGHSKKTNPNKPNFKMGKMTISTAILKIYANEQRTMDNEHHPKQT